MICEYTNKLIRFVSYAFFGEDGTGMVRDEYSVPDVIAFVFIALMTLILVAWWSIPLRKLGVYNNVFTCDRKE